MPKILHLIENLDDRIARSLVPATAYSVMLHQYDHTFVVAGMATPSALRTAQEADIEVVVTPEATSLQLMLSNADIVQIAYRNTPRINALLRGTLPPMRLAIWSHVHGTTAPHLLPRHICKMADICIDGRHIKDPHLNHLQLITSDELDTVNQEMAGTGFLHNIVPSPDFSMLADYVPEAHTAFNIGFAAHPTINCLHPEFASINEKIQLPGAQLLILGDSEYLAQQTSESSIADRYVFLPTDASTLSLMKQLDVFGCPFGAEGSEDAQAYIQLAMYAGIPVVVFDPSHVQGLIKHNETGFHAQSAEDYVRTIEFLHNNPQERTRIGLNASIFAKTHLGARNVAHELHKVYALLQAQPKTHHAWGQRPQATPVSTPEATPPLSHQLVEALDGEGLAFEISLSHPEIQQQISAERSIATATPAMAAYIERYARCATSDPHIQLWSGLSLEKDKPDAAISAFAAAIEHGFSHWRAQWYLARTLNNVGKTEESRRIYEGLRLANPEFNEITGDTLFDQPVRPPLQMTIPGIKPTANMDATDEAATGQEGTTEQDTMDTPPVIRVSAIVSTYASESFIDGCLHNLVSQSLFQKGELEIIVIDAASPENEKDIIERYQENFNNIVYLRTPAREGLYASWNRGIKLAKGDYITSANTDDRHRKDALEILANYLDAHPEFALLYPGQIDTSVPNETFETSSSQKRLNWPTYSYAELERHCIIGSQPMWRKAMHDKYGYFREDFVSAGDYEFWLRMGRHENFFRYPETLGLYFRNPAGIEHGNKHSENETLQIWQEYGMFDRGIPVILGGRVIQKARTPAFSSPTSTASPTRQPFDFYIQKFETAIVENNLPAAMEVAEATIKYYGELPYPQILRAIVLTRQGHYADALEALNQSIQIDETPEALMELIQLSIASGQEEEALRTTVYIEQKYPDWKDKLQDIKQTLLRDNTTQVRGQARLDDLDYSITSFANLKNQFEELLHLKDIGRAEQLAKAAILKFPENHEAWVLKATSDRLNGAFLEAQEAIQQSLLIEDSPEALIELYEVSQALGDEEEAQNIASMFDMAYPEHASSFSHLFPDAIIKTAE